jgi:hypothetical protein
MLLRNSFSSTYSVGSWDLALQAQGGLSKSRLLAYANYPLSLNRYPSC